MSDLNPKAQAELERILESARRLGVEVNEADALQWLTNMAAAKEGDGITMDERTGVFGHNVSMLDFSQDELEYFRRIGRLVEFTDIPGQVETALALSGSAAQSKIQSYPGDCDYFERVNLLAPTREEACQLMARIMREKALSALQGPTYQLIEVKFGSYPEEIIVGDRTCRAGTPIAWKPSQIQAGKIEGFHADGTPAEITWEQAANDPGWCKLDWVVADPLRKQLANASNMLDVTWEQPEREVRKYLTKDINYGKVAKRMYNIFRLTGRYEEAAFLRELFDEPATILYQVWSLIRTIDDAYSAGSSIPQGELIAAADRLILDVIKALEGDQEAQIVRHLLRLRDALSRPEAGISLTAEAEAARAEVINIVNNFFYDRLVGMPAIRTYIEGFVPPAV